MSDIEDTINRSCPVYALQPIKIMGMTTGSLLIVSIVVLALNKAIGIAYALALGWTIAFSIERAAAKAKIPGGFLQYKLSVLAGHPMVKQYAPGLSKGIGKIWVAGGLIEPPGVRSKYIP